MSQIIVGIPAYNEEPAIAQTISTIQQFGYKDIVIVDDCSKDNTAKIAQNSGAHVISLPINRGAGGATSTIIKYALKQNYDYLVLIDADLQHNPKEISKLLKYKEKYDVIIGSRMVGHLSEMPMSRRIANTIGSYLTWTFFGKFVYDSQSGFKVLNRRAIEHIQLTFDRYEFCSELIGECYKHNLSVKEVPIGVHYSKHSLEKGHGQSVLNGFTMFVRFLLK
ncbi:MAG: glycosyltransferase family 2 protein [Candidatus Nanoarchaeia archaeon]